MLPAEFIIRCQNLTLGYGNEIVLERVSLDIPKGVFLPFIGPNGAGKTTFLRALLGFVRPFSGTIETPFEKSPAGYVPQHKTIDPLFPVSVRKIAAMGLYPRLGFWKRPGKEENMQIDEALDEVGLLAHQSKLYRELSGGMKQKALIARALASGAEVFIMDEPTSELDEPSERDVFGHLTRFVREQGKTVLIAHHGLSRILESLASEVCVVHARRLKKMKAQDLPREGGF